MFTIQSAGGIPASCIITDQELEEQEKKLVAELLRLYREGSSLTVIAARLHELRDVRARMRGRTSPPTAQVSVS